MKMVFSIPRNNLLFLVSNETNGNTAKQSQSTVYCLQISFVVLLESVIESHADRLVVVGLKYLGTQYFRVSRISYNLRVM